MHIHAVLCDSWSGMATRGDTGGTQENKFMMNFEETGGMPPHAEPHGKATG